MNDSLWLGIGSFELRIVPWKHEKLFLSPMEVLKVYCVDIVKAPWVGWFVCFKENTNICTVWKKKTPHLFVESLCMDYFYSDG